MDEEDADATVDATGRPDQHVDPAAYAALQARIYATSLKVWWSREWGYASLLDPFTGEVFDISIEDAPKWMKRRAFEEKGRQAGRRPRPGTWHAWERPGSSG